MRTKGHYKILMFCALAYLWQFSFFSIAQEDTSKVLKTVTVPAGTNSKAPEDSTRLLNTVDIPHENPHVWTLPAPVPGRILSGERLNDLAVIDVGSALKYVPGVQLKDYGGVGGIRTVSFRSLGAAHTGVILDGIKIPNVQSGAINLSSFEIFGVQNMSFLSGGIGNNYLAPASSYLQANIVSIRSVLTMRPEKLNIRLYSNASSIHSFEEGVMFRAPLGEKSFIGVQAMTKFGKGNYQFTYEPAGVTSTMRRENSTMQQNKLKLAGGVNFKRSNFFFDFNYLDNAQELPGAVVLYNTSNDQQLWNEDARLAVRYYREGTKKWTIASHAFVQNNRMRYYDPHFLNLQGSIDNNYTQRNAGGGMMFHRAFQNKPLSRLYFGSDALASVLDGSNLVSDPKRFESNAVVGYNHAFDKLFVYSNLALQVIFDEHGSPGSETKRHFIKPSPFLSVMYLVSHKHRLAVRSHYKRTFVMPTFNDLYYNFIGNNELKPEEADIFNAGLSYEKIYGRMTIQLTADAYYNRVRNKIVAIPTKDIFNWSMQNIGETEIKGYDIGFYVALQKKEVQLQLNASYSYNHSLDVTDPGSSTYESQIPYTPFHSGNGGVAFDFRGFAANVNVIYTGFRYSLNENSYANYLAPFADISVNASQRIVFENKSFVNIGVAAMNLLNKNYEVIRSFPMPGRYYQCTLQFAL